MELIEAGVQSGRLRATTSASEALEQADVSLICVGTPSGSHGSTDLSYIGRVAADIRAAMAHVAPPASGFHAVVVRSTVPPGTVTSFSPLVAVRSVGGMRTVLTMPPPAMPRTRSKTVG